MALLYTSRLAIQSGNFTQRTTATRTRKAQLAMPPSGSQPSSDIPSRPSLQSWNSLPPEQLNPLLTRQFITGKQCMLARIVLLKGCVVPEHSHPNEQLAFILEGALRFEIAGETHTVRAGEVLVIPANIPHSAVALEDTIDFDVFAPPRQDWISGEDAYLLAPANSTR